MNDYKIQISELLELAEWADSNIYDVPINLPDMLREAADTIEQLGGEIEK